MARKTKEELKSIREEKAINSFISSNKFLSDAKYFKNNYWSMAAWDSWAARGQAGGCGCCPERSYNGTLCNKRAANKWCKHVSRNLCSDCIGKIEKKLNINFKRY